MNKKTFYKIVAIILIFCILPKPAYAVPPSLRDIKANKEYKIIFNEIGEVRNNITLLDVNALTAKEKYNRIEREVNFYSSQLNTIEIEIDKIKKEQFNSIPDQMCGRQLMLICESIKLSIEQLNFQLDIIKADESEGSDLFYSDYLVHSYYYLNIADATIDHVGRYYKFK